MSQKCGVFLSFSDVNNARLCHSTNIYKCVGNRINDPRSNTYDTYHNVVFVSLTDSHLHHL